MAAVALRKETPPVKASAPPPPAAIEKYDTGYRRAVAQKVNRIDIYKQAAAATKTPLPKDSFRTAKLMDGMVWDGKDAKKYAGAFKIRAVA